jgi:hypothetical protein
LGNYDIGLTPIDDRLKAGIMPDRIASLWDDINVDP